MWFVTSDWALFSSVVTQIVMWHLKQLKPTVSKHPFTQACRPTSIKRKQSVVAHCWQWVSELFNTYSLGVEHPGGPQEERVQWQRDSNKLFCCCRGRSSADEHIFSWQGVCDIGKRWNWTGAASCVSVSEIIPSQYHGQVEDIVHITNIVSYILY